MKDSSITIEKKPALYIDILLKHFWCARLS